MLRGFVAGSASTVMDDDYKNNHYGGTPLTLSTEQFTFSLVVLATKCCSINVARTIQQINCLWFRGIISFIGGRIQNTIVEEELILRTFLILKLENNLLQPSLCPTEDSAYKSSRNGFTEWAYRPVCISHEKSNVTAYQVHFSPLRYKFL